MTTNRPFLYNFLTAFRTHLPKPGTTTNTSSVWTSAAVSTSQVSAMSTLTSPRPIIDPRKAVLSTTTTNTTTNPPLARSTSPGPSPALHHTVSPLTHGQRTSPTTTAGEHHHHHPHHHHQRHHDRRPPGTQHVPPAPSSPATIPSSTTTSGPQQQNTGVSSKSRGESSYDRRRGSDSSSEGAFRDARGDNKWYIGGRTAGGEERFYRLGLVRRDRSLDRLSADRLSL